MKTTRLFFIAFVAVVLIAAVGIPTKPQFSVQNGEEEVFMAGRNVNMVSGTTLPYGDPYLQRQNEPSLAVSSRNPLHLLAGANDYRTVDMPIVDEELPGIEEMMAADAWLGYYTSDDGGESWKSYLLPGFPQDEGSTSPLRAYSTAADPWVCAGSEGKFYYSGLAFNRGGDESAIFVARFEDTNDKETGETIEYRGVEIVATGNAGQFVDMPRMAVDVPRGASNDIVFLVYTVFVGNLDVNIRSKMYCTRSTDGGLTWSSPTKLSESQHIIQGAAIAIDPLNGDVYVALRRFYHKSQENGIVVVKSTDRGQTFSNPQEIATFPTDAFDQPATPNESLYPDPDDYVPGESFRTNSYPTIAVDDLHRVYVAWSERNRGPGGEARIVMKTSLGGSTWSPSVAMDINPPGSFHQGHEFMPQWAYGAGKMTLIWYDQRFDQVGHDVGFEHYIGDWITNTYGDVMRHTIDVWAAQFNPSDYADPTQWSYTQVSRYLYALLVDEGGEVFLVDGYPYIYPIQFNCLNYPMFKGGFLPFMGDYIALAASPTIILNDNNNWVFNTEFSENPVFHAAWTDNRDVRPPAGLFDWTDYTPANSAQDQIYVSPGRTDCSAGGNRPAIRNQNIYTAKLFWGIVAGSPANEKSLDLSVPRAFVVFVQNNTELFLRVRMAITEQPLNGEASFFQFDSLDELFITIAPYSTVSRQVFLQPSDYNDSARIDIVEVDAGGLSGYVIINGDPSNTGVSGDEEYHQPQFSNPNIVNWVVNPNIVNPNIVNPNIDNPNIVNPNIVNPNIVNPNIVNEPINPNIVNPNIVNPNIVNPNIVNPNIVNPNIVNPNIVNPNIVNPNIVNTSLPGGADEVPVYDVMWTVKNVGNTATTYTLDTVAKTAPPEGIYTQLLIYRVHKTPAIAGSVLSSSSPDYDECTLYEEPHHELILNILNPNIVNPNIVNLGTVNPNIVNPNIVNESITNATFALGPGEEAIIDLRVLDTEGISAVQGIVSPQDQFSIQTFDFSEFIYSIGFVVTSMAVDSDDAAAGKRIPKGAATDLYIVSSNPPDGLVGQYYKEYLTAFGGTSPYNYTWSLNSGELPPGLSISTGMTPDSEAEGAPGIISGTPTAAGTYVFIVQVTDDNDPLHVDTQLFSITTHTGIIPDTPIITTTSLPSGVRNTWYGATIHVAGGDPPFTFSWSAQGTSTPEADGLMLDPVNGIITGTPTVATSYNFDVTVTDIDNHSSVPVNLDLDILESTGNYYVISGTVYDDASDPLEGVQMYGLPNSPVTDASGDYEDYVPEGWSGTVIPFKLDYFFTPENRVYTQVSSNQYGHDYNAYGAYEWYETRADVVRVTDMVVDSFGNALVSGVGNTGAYVAKYDNAGTFIWEYRDGSTAEDLFYGLCVDPDGNVYVTGRVNEDIKTIKLDPDGIVQWSDVYNSGHIHDEGLDIAIDALGNVFVTGASATATLDMPDFITIKYDPSGTREWENVYDNGDIDRGHRVAIDSEGNIIAAGESVDLVGGTGGDLFIFKYDTLGDVIWTARYDNSFSLDAVEDLCLDSAGNVYVTGWTSTGENQADYLTVKYSSPGVFGWATTYDGAGDQFDDWAYAITVDADGYVYVTGRSGENLCAPPNVCDDYATIKYDPSGNPVWTPGGDIDPYGAARYDGPPGIDHDVAQDIEVDPLGNVYVTGRSVGNDGSFDFATLIYDSSGVNIWEARYGIESRHDEAGEIELDPEGNIFVSGPSGDELLVLKYTQNFPTTLSITTEVLPNGFVGLYYNAVLEVFGGTGVYDWSISAGALPAGLNIDGPTGLIFGTPTTAGTYNFTVEVTDGVLTDSKPMSITVVLPAIPPEINIKQDTTEITDGSGFDFGSQAVGTYTDVIFTIENLGTGDLTITTPISIIGTDSDQFSVQAQPTSPVTPAGSTTFTIRFSPTTEGAKSASIAIGNNDADENPYDITLIGTGTAAPAVAAWAKTYGGSFEDLAYSIQQTIDSSYIVAGNTDSFGSGPGINDLWVLKLDAAGDVVWQKTYGGSDSDQARSIQQTSDGGYIVAGNTIYFGIGSSDFWVLKLDAAGDVVWQKTYGVSFEDGAYSIQQTSDGGYIVAGYAYPFGAGPHDFWVLKLDAAGDVVWQKTYGGSDGDYACSIQQTFDGGYIVAGYAYSFGAGSYDFWVLKLDTAGDVVWQKTYGGSDEDYAYSIQQTSDSGYIIAGYTSSYGAGLFDSWVLKLDTAGDVVWQKTYGGSGTDFAHSIQQTSDGGYIVAGYTYSFGAGNCDSWVLKLDEAGDVVWQKTYGGSDSDYARSIQQTSDGGYIAAGYTISFGAGSRDFWVLKLMPDGGIDPSCASEIGADSTAASASTSVTPSTSAATAVDSAATVTDTSVTPADSFAIVQTQCESVYEIYEFVGEWGTYGTGDGELRNPGGIAIDSSGDIYVADTENNRIQKFTSDGTFLAKWGTYGTGDGDFFKPVGIAVDSSGDIYVTDAGNNRIQKFTSIGTFLAKWGTLGNGDGEFNYPSGIAVDGSGDIYVADTDNDRIQKFTSDGTFLAKWGSSGTGDGEFGHPEGIAFDSSGYIYVVERFNDRIQKFTSIGTFVAKWGTLGNGDGQFYAPSGIAIDSSGDIYVTDMGNYRIQKFTSDGTFVTKWGTYGTGDGQFDLPYEIEVDSSGDIYVTDCWNHRIQKFQKQ